MSIFFLVSIAIFIATLLLVIIRPKKLGIGYSALMGAAVSFAVGIINVHDILVVWDIIWNATFTFVAIIIISLVLDEAGVFEYAAIRMARLSGGKGTRLFILVIILGAGISAIFANDGTALILTPIIYLLLYRANVDRKAIIPFIMATGFIADSSSLPLVISNLVNILTAGYFGITFLQYAFRMLLPDLVSILASILFLYLYYRRVIPESLDMSRMRDEGSVIRDPFIFRITLPLVIILLIAYSLGGLFSIPVSLVAAPASVILLIIARMNRKVDVVKPIREAPWQIVLFSLGMYLVVFGLGREGMTSLLSGVLSSMSSIYPPVRVLLSGYLFASIAAVMNNMPSIMLGNLALSSMHGSASLIYANVVGNDIGPKFTPIGSLATLVWIHTLNRKSGITISAAYYMKVGFLIGLPVLTLTLLSLTI